MTASNVTFYERVEDALKDKQLNGFDVLFS